MTHESINDPDAAVAALRRLYEAETSRLRDSFAAFARGERLDAPVTGFYPRLAVKVETALPHPPAQSFGFCDAAGRFETTITRPDLFESYLLVQLRELAANHACGFEVGLSDMKLPIHFAYPDGLNLEGAISVDQLADFSRLFDAPDLATMDDQHVNGEIDYIGATTRPLSLFSAPRVDYSLHRLSHYTGTGAEHFQNFVLFTNYQFYVDGFRRMAEERVADPDSGYDAFVEPRPAHHPPQMPAFHLKRPDHDGITLINIGVGPSNAKTMTDHVAVLRPSAWVMLGHCAGLRRTQRLGDYVLAHGYVRDDHVLDADLPVWVPIPALAEVQQSLEGAVSEVAGVAADELKQVMRTGTVASIDNRNWELRDQSEPIRRFSQSRAIGLDMESATIAANGFRFRVPYGTLLVVSDRPMHGELKLPGMASEFYRRQVDRHLAIGVRAMELLRAMPTVRLHSRKLRSFNEVPFQ
ncbi:AMP nucleosidase [Pikeienuella piscinae]|uniref:AMP nucleosidase n=1 Tax=Pikeienuella piscinae TaxID=2748098 RepID=A0A7L5BZS0_9RHOB|nr:AMP nucleosidase [Pikeienuella piscinae]QIE56338.1 AMP nucleosidase [Pikeienuella piscinae]